MRFRITHSSKNYHFGNWYLFAVLILLSNTIYAQKIHKFEKIGVVDGLSHNYVQSIYCDHDGFLWFGTWDGLNRYDGRNFKVFKVDPKQRHTLTNNRVVEIWGDQQNIMWVKTYDGYIHYYVKETYSFYTYPFYLKSLKENNSTVSCFKETNHKEVFLGTTHSGLYHLTYDPQTFKYDEKHIYTTSNSKLTSNHISFVISDPLSDIWIGTNHGLNHVPRHQLEQPHSILSNYWLKDNFTHGISIDSLLVFCTSDGHFRTYQTKDRKFDSAPTIFEAFKGKNITLLDHPYKETLLIGTKEHGLYTVNLRTGLTEHHLLAGKTINKVYKDSFGTLWINTSEFGIYHVKSDLESIRHYDLIPSSMKNIVDDERQYIYEDSHLNLWIALHGGGLAQFNREDEAFEFYRNVPNDNSTISSDNVYCIAEDQSGLLWAGTGPTNGGVNKIYTSKDAFDVIKLQESLKTGNENVVRALLIDNNENIWVGTKSGITYVLSSDGHPKHIFSDIPIQRGTYPGQNVYTLLQDQKGHIWMGTKGGGLFVSQLPVDSTTNYHNIRFYKYSHFSGDTASISSNIIYSIMQDHKGRIWIGSYKTGLQLVISRTPQSITCRNYTTKNSSISSNKIRNLLEDHEHRLWIATAFGLNYLDLDSLDLNAPDIHPIFYDPRYTNSLSYNDVIHVFEDAEQTLWFGTSGGGANVLKYLSHDSVYFDHITTSSGLINDVVYAFQQDSDGLIWISTNHGVSRYNKESGTFDNFDRTNSLNSDVFNENTCAQLPNGALLFGTNNGILSIKPEEIRRNAFKPEIELTNFQLFNKDINIYDPQSPIQQNIETLDKIDLNYNQSSFSIEYAALSYFAPSKNKYAFKLDNFDPQWNEVGNQNKATYTNLTPGHYTFKVKAANWNSDWNDDIRSIEITIHPPWYKTMIMYFVYAFVTVLIIETIRRTYIRYHKLQNDLRVEKRVNDIKLQFFTNISHEIRTPLTLILGPIHDILEMKDIPSRVSKKLLLVEKNGARMLRLVNQLLDFRRMQKKKMDLHIHKIELTSFVASILENFNLITEQKQMTVHYKFEKDNIEVWADPHKFDSVLFNLLSNAYKFSPKHSTINVEIINSHPKYIDVVISDEGKGISPEHINQLFQRFSPLTEQNEAFGSSGIGLAYSYEIMKLHRGDILVNSQPGHGAEFIIRVPRGQEHFNASNIHISEDIPDVPHHHKREIEENVEENHTKSQKEKSLQILIVEDNHQIVQYLKENLEEDYFIAVSHNGKEALDYLHDHTPDLIISDVMMPEVDGIELTQKIKSNDDTSHIPVIILTAKSAVEDQITGIESGAEAYILKPFNMGYVRAIIANLIRQRQLISARYVQNKNDHTEEIKITTKDELFLDNISNIIMESYSDPEFNIEKLVEKSYVSRTVFYHKIKSLTGLTPIDFLRQKRLHIASQLIIETDYNISEIATMTGFNDIKNFSKRFKEIYQSTPSQYKKTHAVKHSS